MDGFDDAVRAFAAVGRARLQRHRALQVRVRRAGRTVTPRAALAQAANVLRFDAGGWLADNTDGIGLVRDLQRNAGVPLAGPRVLLIGAGGAAAGVLGPLIEARPAQLHVANRTRRQGRGAGARHAALAAACGTALSCSGLDDGGEAYDVVLNSSASSLGGAAVPVADACSARHAGGGPDVRRRRTALPGLGAAHGRPCRATAWACWSSRRPRPSSCGAR